MEGTTTIWLSLRDNLRQVKEHKKTLQPPWRLQSLFVLQ